MQLSLNSKRSLDDSDLFYRSEDDISASFNPRPVQEEEPIDSMLPTIAIQHCTEESDEEEIKIAIPIINR